MTSFSPCRRACRRLPLLVGAVIAMALVLSLPAVPLALAAFEVIGSVEEVIDRPPLPDELPRSAEFSTVRATDGSYLGELASHERRDPIRIDDVPQVVIDAVLAVEDTDFYAHNGVDHRAIARAAARNLVARGIEQGGSTITQQYVKMILLDPSRTLERKLHEVVWAVELERRWDKAEILEGYLNAVYLGQGVYGFGTAADHYFSKPIGELDVAEAALLAGAVQAPSTTNPVTDPDAATARRDTVIRRMRRDGRITQA